MCEDAARHLEHLRIRSFTLNFNGRWNSLSLLEATHFFDFGIVQTNRWPSIGRYAKTLCRTNRLRCYHSRCFLERNCNPLSQGSPKVHARRGNAWYTTYVRTKGAMVLIWFLIKMGGPNPTGMCAQKNMQNDHEGRHNKFAVNC